LQGLAAATSIPSILSYLSARTEGSLALRGRVMSIFEVTTAIGLLVGPIVGVQLWQFLGPWGFTVTALLFLVSGAFFWIIRDDRQTAMDHQAARTDEPFLPRLTRVLRRGDLLSFAPAWLSINAVVGLWGTHLIYQMRAGSDFANQYLTGYFDENAISGMLAGYGLIFCIGVVAWGFSFGKVRELTVMRLSLFGLFGLCLTVFGINHSGDQEGARWLFVAAAAVALAVQSGFAPAAVTFLARLAARSSQDRGLFMGIYSVVLGLGQFIGHTLGGPFADRGGVDGILLLTLILGLIATTTILRLSLRNEPEGAASPEASLSLHA
jgi:predicted MFS family arabinose efflux permease